jgi:hypothetical protein
MDARRGVSIGAGFALVGAIASGPLSLWVQARTHPQPSWRDATTFAAAYHPVQALPYALGCLLVGGFVVLLASLHRLAPTEARARTTAALVFVAVFAAMIMSNYAVQTTFVPALLRSGTTSDVQLAAAVTMANPRSLGWALEMWGYAVLGVATWLAAPVFAGSALARAARVLFTVNAPVSIVAAVAAAVRPGWVTTPIGVAAFILWNGLVVAMTVLALLAMRARARVT